MCDFYSCDFERISCNRKYQQQVSQSFLFFLGGNFFPVHGIRFCLFNFARETIFLVNNSLLLFFFKCYLVVLDGSFLPNAFKDSRIQARFFASDIRMYMIGICLGDGTFTSKQYITNTSQVINNSDINYEHVVQLTQALTYPSASTHS